MAVALEGGVMETTEDGDDGAHCAFEGVEGRRAAYGPHVHSKGVARTDPGVAD